MQLEPEQARTIALRLAQGRAILGLTMLALPQLASRAWLGGSTPEHRAAVRMLAARDLVLGVSAITTLKEQTLDAELVGMGALADGVDTIALTLGGGPKPMKAAGVAAAAVAAVAGMLCARVIADARGARA